MKKTELSEVFQKGINDEVFVLEQRKVGIAKVILKLFLKLGV